MHGKSRSYHMHAAESGHKAVTPGGWGNLKSLLQRRAGVGHYGAFLPFSALSRSGASLICFTFKWVCW